MEMAEGTVKAKRNKRTSSELKALCEGFSSSGLSATAYCKKVNINYQSFQKYSASNIPFPFQDSRAFVPIVPTNSRCLDKNVALTSNPIQFLFPNGVKLIVPNLTPDLIQQIVSLRG